MANAYNKREIDRVVYSLRKQWGTTVTWRSYQDMSLDVFTGQQDVQFIDYVIQKGILLPADIQKVNNYRLLMSAIFKQGGVFDVDTRYLIIRLSDLPTGYDVNNPNENDELTIDGNKYSIKSINIEYGVYIKLKRILP